MQLNINPTLPSPLLLVAVSLWFLASALSKAYSFISVVDGETKPAEGASVDPQPPKTTEIVAANISEPCEPAVNGKLPILI